MISSEGLGLLFKIKGDSSGGKRASTEFREQVQKDIKAVEQSTASLDSANSQLSKGFDGIAGSSGRASAALSSFVGNLAADAAIKFSQALIDGGKAVLDYSSKLENAKVGFTTLTGSATVAQKHLEDLQKFAAKTSFDFAGVAEASQKLQGAGIGIEKIIPLLSDFGNALAAAGKGQESMDRLVKAISDVQTKQHLATQEIRQFSEIGIPIYKILGDQLHKTTAEIDDLVTQGRISADVFNEAFSRFSKANFGDAMAAQAKTFSGATENIKDSLLIVASTAFAPLYKQISELASRFASEIQSKGNDFEAVGNTIAKYIGEGLELGLEAVIKSLGAYLGTRLSEIFTEGKIVAPIVSSFVEGFTKPIGKAYDEIGVKLTHLIGLKTYNERNSVNQPQPYLTSDDMETRMPGQNDSFQPNLQLSPAKPKKTRKEAVDSFDREFRGIAKDFGFTVGRTLGGAINSGSLHPLGKAGDLRVGGKTNEESFNVIAAFLEKGFRVIDERIVGAFPGIKSTCPNIHAEQGAGIKPSLFLNASKYGGEGNLAYLKKLDEDRRNKKTSTDDAAEFAKKRVADEKKANEEIVKNREIADKRVLENARNTAAEEKAINDNLLAKNLISQDEYDKRVEQSAIDLLTKEKILLDERLALAKQHGADTAEIEQEIADKVSEIKVKQSSAETADYLRSKKYAEDLKALRLEVAQSELELFNSRKEEERKNLENDVTKRLCTGSAEV